MTKIVVVGAGFGGLAAAVRLLAAGYDVTVVEALERPGGRAGWLELGPYRFDTGPTLVTLPSLFEELCRLAGTTLQDEVELIPLRPAYRILFSDGKQFDYWGDAARDAEENARFDPTAVGTYRAFIATTRHIYERAFGDLARRPFDRLPLFLRVLPELIHLRAHESVYQFVSRYFRESHLRMAFSFHPLFIGGNPLRASAIYSIVPYLERLEGVYFARGGMRSLVDLLTRLLTRLGGELLLGTPVEQLRIDPLGRIRGVVLADGRHRECGGRQRRHRTDGRGPFAARHDYGLATVDPSRSLLYELLPALCWRGSSVLPISASHDHYAARLCTAVARTL
ncbi:phytoene desaturase family protein [Thermomicrobium sp. CFH 73360]|uniref:phytoene desaturase family protein n=1 Tax=Thermomicrobium sp. CFH 73360 TaxID=2951987 RepID=UPI002076825F|nr:phytoene desaturase family protein [Thermomicrobium sp. CFH 73360]MCM8745041.1 phytoene desaturase family protein [Thermomicrobium sp. CFH 73360]